MIKPPLFFAVELLEPDPDPDPDLDLDLDPDPDPEPDLGISAHERLT